MQKGRSVGVYGTTTLLTYLRALLNLCIGSLGTVIHVNIIRDIPRIILNIRIANTGNLKYPDYVKVVSSVTVVFSKKKWLQKIRLKQIRQCRIPHLCRSSFLYKPLILPGLCFCWFKFTIYQTFPLSLRNTFQNPAMYIFPKRQLITPRACCEL